jgi:hypothetical protein
MQLRQNQQRHIQVLVRRFVAAGSNISDKSHGREVGWLALPVQLNTSLCF